MKRFMTTKMAMSVLVIAVAMTMVGMGTFALFTDEVSSGVNTFESGHVTLTQGSSANWTANVQAMYPGMADVTLTFDATYTGMNATLASTLTVVDPDNCLVITPTLATGPVVDNGDATSTVVVSWNNSLLDDNVCQDKTATISLTTEATQS
ncbi:MAG: TasA family protein [Thermoleophilia bacterium]